MVVRAVALLALVGVASGFSTSKRRVCTAEKATVARRAVDDASEKVASSTDEITSRRSRLHRITAEIEAVERALTEENHDAERVGALATRVSDLVLRGDGYSPAIAARISKLAERTASAATTTMTSVVNAEVAPVENGEASAKPKKKAALKANTRVQVKTASRAAKTGAAKTSGPASKDGKVRVGDVVDGTCASIEKYGAFIQVEGMVKPALLHISEISNARVESIAEVFPVGTKVRCVVATMDKGRVALSTKRLESRPGEMLEDPQRVYRRAEKAAAKNAYQTRSAARANRPVKQDVAASLEDLAQAFSLDDLDDLLLAPKRRSKKARKAAPRVKEAPEKTGPGRVADSLQSAEPADAEAVAEEEAPSALSLASAFQPVTQTKLERQEEFELLMRDVIYESSTSLTDVRKSVIGNRKKRGSFQSPFWRKVFPNKQ